LKAGRRRPSRAARKTKTNEPIVGDNHEDVWVKRRECIGRDHDSVDPYLSSDSASVLHVQQTTMNSVAESSPT